MLFSVGNLFLTVGFSGIRMHQSMFEKEAERCHLLLLFWDLCHLEHLAVRDPSINGEDSRRYWPGFGRDDS